MTKIKSGTVIGGSAGKTSTKAKIKSGTVIGTSDLPENGTALILPGMPAEKQIHLTDTQKQEAAAANSTDCLVSIPCISA